MPRVAIGHAVISSSARVGLLALLACATGSAAHAQAISNLYTDPTSVFVPFVNPPPAGQITSPQSVSIGFDTKPGTVNVLVDTGSVGLAIAQQYVNPTGPSLGSGSITYTSSGNIEMGNYYMEKINFYNGKTIVATASVPVLVVNQISCEMNARDCTPQTNQSLIYTANMGVGFGQEADGQANGTPNANPFLNIVSTASSGPLPSRGYVVTASGVDIGLTQANTQGYATVKLAPYPAYATPTTPEWLRAPATLVVNGTAGSGSVLTDTGLADMYLTPAPGTMVQVGTTGATCGANCALPGTQINILLPGQAAPVASYTITVGAMGGPQSGNPLSPDSVAVDPASNVTFVNTTVHFLNGYNYFYDAANGFVGYQWTGAVSGQYGGATPSFAMQGSVSLPGGFTTSLPVNLLNVSQVANAGGFDDVTGLGVTISAQGTATFSGPISGLPDLTFGGGTIVLSGANTYSGATIIAPGATLAMAGAGSIAASAGVTANGVFDISQSSGGQTIASLAGAGGVNLGGQALTIANASGMFSGVIADGGLGGGAGGSLVIAGGTQGLGNVNTYTGATTIAPGATLALAGGGSIAASSGVTANGVFDISQSAGGQAIASLAGAGSVNLGGQALVLTQASGTFSGVIADGGLGGGSGGSLAIAGGKETLTGINTYTGGTAITGGGALAINADAALGAASGPLTFDRGTLLTGGGYATSRPINVAAGGGAIDAAGGAVALGGNLMIEGPLSVRGDLTVAGGLIQDNATLTASSLMVAAGATLRGIGIVAARTTVAGTLAPGNSPGTLTFTAPVTLGSGAVTRLDIDGAGTGTGAGNYSRILVSGAGNGFAAAGRLEPQLRGISGSAGNAYTPPLGQNFVVVDAQGGVQGRFASLAQPAGLLAGTRFDALYGADTVTLVVRPISYGALTPAGLTPSANQGAVGSALDSLIPADGVAMTASQTALLTPLYQLPAGDIQAALEALTPEIDADAMMVWRDAWYLVGGAIGSAMETRRGGQPDSQEQTAEGPKGSTIWLTALGQFGNVGSANGVPGYSGSTGGVVAGVDMPVLPWVTTGGALAFTSPQVSTKTGQTFSGQALQVTAYASAHQGILFADAQLGGMFFQDTTQRPLPLYGVQANGQAGGTGVGGSVRAGAHLQVASWQVEPSLALAGLGLSQGGFTETQAGAANLSVSGQGLTSIQSVLAARAERRFAVSETMALVPTARIGWAHEFADTVGTATATFAGGGAPFSVESAPIGRDAALIGLGATLQTGGPVSLYLAYNGAFAQNTNAQTLTGGVSVKW